MAKTKKKPAQTRKTKSRVAEVIEEAAETAAQESDTLDFDFDSPEDRDLHLATAENELLTDAEIDERDIFAESIAKARARNTSAKFRIYRDGEWLSTLGGTFSWEMLQAKYGPGYYKVVAVNRDNQIMGSQTQQVAPPDGWNQNQNNQNQQPQHPMQNSPPNTLEVLEVMKDGAREARSEAQNQNTSLATVMSTMMQTMMTMQQESSRQFQTLMLEQQREARATQERALERDRDRAEREFKMQMEMMKLMSTKKDDGMSPLIVMEKLRDAEKRGIDQTKMWFDLIDKKSEKLAEEKAQLMAAAGGDGDGEESLSKSLVKGFIPLLTQVLSQNGAAVMAGTGPQAMLPPAPRQPTPQELATRNFQREERRKLNQRNPEIVEGPKGTDQTVRKEKSGQDLKIALFNLASPMIGEALANQRSASATAEQVLMALEKGGFERQTVCKAFTLEEFYVFAAQSGAPDIVKPWLKEFHEALAKPIVATSSANGNLAQSPVGQANDTQAKPKIVSDRTTRRPSIRTADPIVR